MKNVRILISAMAGKVGNYIFALESLGAQVHCSLDPLVSAADADALLLPGGGDIDPAYYGEAINGSQQIDRELDQLQFSALDAFVRSGKPVLGICRGHQVINVYFGGTLIQHLPTADSHTAFSCQGVSHDRIHSVTALPGSVPASLYGERFAVNSAHHQAPGRAGTGLQICARSDDGTIEALCHQTLPVLSVQWHPERLCFRHARTDACDGSLLLKYFLSLC
ncbi:MAG: gamma-glutamyl-gamma-aminobutyrate hydrolase family protein [Clostridia bacterium]|nr:gamma-glutamyl-gamma-aminobutyrate hydrolase family protein [Clostridia bacterium]